jgi:hypothetical protein
LELKQVEPQNPKDNDNLGTKSMLSGLSGKRHSSSMLRSLIQKLLEQMQQLNLQIQANNQTAVQAPEETLHMLSNFQESLPRRRQGVKCAFGSRRKGKGQWQVGQRKG